MENSCTQDALTWPGIFIYYWVYNSNIYLAEARETLELESTTFQGYKIKSYGFGLLYSYEVTNEEIISVIIAFCATEKKLFKMVKGLEYYSPIRAAR